MNKKYFEFEGQRYDIGTKVEVQLADESTMETTYLGFGWFENLTPNVTDFTIKKIVTPKYFVEVR